MLSVSDVSVSYGKLKVLSNVNLEIPMATITGLVAPNGYGKTTLLRTIAGLIPFYKGIVTIDGIRASQRISYYKKLFFIEDSSVLNPIMSPLDYLLLVKKAWQSGVDIDVVVETVRIGGFLRKPINKLSLGMKQQTVIAMCLVSDAEYILLDEPMNGLDPTNTAIMAWQLKLMREQGKSIFMSSHLLSNVDEITDQVVFLKDGGIAKLTSSGQGIRSSDTYQELYFEDEGLVLGLDVLAER
ncbi:MAG: ABC transporter ATP-binding protein [Coriobacteriales bacterium]|jgi:ABC-2 type transport system ATP-binding protein|nr:ABC transporter ATP-binding protein [Coriobacteriales bacterium]